jgi:NAD(P)H-dependent flavin oxidoreductase YrpB (nitropropane dioxygenase family)
MGFLTGAELAAAVSNAGGLGIMSARSLEDVQFLVSNPFPFNIELIGDFLSRDHLPSPVAWVNEI